MRINLLNIREEIAYGTEENRSTQLEHVCTFTRVTFIQTPLIHPTSNKYCTNTTYKSDLFGITSFKSATSETLDSDRTVKFRPSFAGEFLFWNFITKVSWHKVCYRKAWKRSNALINKNSGLSVFIIFTIL